MRVAFNIEANGLVPSEVWSIVLKDIDNGDYHVYQNPTQDEEELRRFQEAASRVTFWVGHNILGYDFNVANRLCGLVHPPMDDIIDTLVISKLIDYPRKGHSAEDYAEEFNMGRQPQVPYDKYSIELEEYCKRKVDIAHLIYNKYYKYISNKDHRLSIDIEQSFQRYVVNSLEDNGFFFNIDKAKKLLDLCIDNLQVLDIDILDTFKPRSKLVREVIPKVTQYGTINKQSIPKVLREQLNNDLSCFSADAPFSLITYKEFNPASPKQVVEVLNEAGWKPIDRTETRKDIEREYNKLKNTRKRNEELDLRLKELYTKIIATENTAWKVNENNLSTLPSSAPAPARLLAKRITWESRRRTLTEWLELVKSDNRIHGRFQGIGAWTHRMAHQHPNTANIPNDLDTFGKKKLLGKELRSLWCAPTKRLLVGVDAEGIQLRIFAHYIDDPEFTLSLVEGRKDDKTDPHSLNQRILGSVCQSRAAAKRFIYALLLGAGLSKLTEILGCTKEETEEALLRLLQRYEGFKFLKEQVISKDAKRGWFLGLDNRKVRIPGDTEGARRHLAMSGYLQNGEAIVMKMATLKWIAKLDDYDAKLVNFVHDEWQTECPNNMQIAIAIAKMQADSLKEVGEELNLKCPLAGSYYNDDIKDYTIGNNWAVTH